MSKRISDYFTKSAKKVKVSEADDEQTTLSQPTNDEPSAPPDPTDDEPCCSTSSEPAVKQWKKRDFQQKWLTDHRYKSWLLYDESKHVMRCSLCISTGKTNPFVTGCCNYRTSTLNRHMSSVDHTNAVVDKVEQSQFKKKVQTAWGQKKQAIISAMRTVY